MYINIRKQMRNDFIITQKDVSSLRQLVLSRTKNGKLFETQAQILMFQKIKTIYNKMLKILK